MNEITTTDTDLAVIVEPVFTQEEVNRVGEYRFASKSPSTIRQYNSAMGEFKKFCAYRGFVALPTTASVIEVYVTDMASTGSSLNTIRVHLAAISYAHDIQGHLNPVRDIHVRETMKGVARKLGPHVNKKTALTVEDLRLACQGFGDDLRGLRDRAMLLVGYFGAFRRSELVAVTVNQVRFERGQTRVLIQHSKTDQEGKGLYKHLPTLKDDLADLCPTKSLRAWLNAAGIGSGPIFRAIDRWGHVRDDFMDPKQVERIAKKAAGLAGLHPAHFAGHSLRSGFVSDSSLAGATDFEIMEQTGHKSRDTVDEYRQMHGTGALNATEKIAEMVRRNLAT